MLAILERIKQIVAERLTKAKALIDTYDNPSDEKKPDIAPEDPSSNRAKPKGK